MAKRKQVHTEHSVGVNILVMVGAVALAGLAFIFYAKGGL